MAVMHLAMLLECSEGLPLHVFDHFLGRYPLIKSFIYFFQPVIKEGPPAQEQETPHVVSEGDVTIGIDCSVHSRFIALTLYH